MKSDRIFNLINQKMNIPKSIEKALYNMYGAHSINDLTNSTKTKIRREHDKIFSEEGTAVYSKIAKEYAIYYLPANFFKIWRPLCDLLEKSEIKNKCTILELGCGPGSATFGLIEFYRVLAEENPTKRFELSIYAIEKEEAFLRIMKEIFELYRLEFPKNLAVNVCSKNQNVSDFFSRSIDIKFDYIVESNMVNPNESLGGYSFEDFGKVICSILKPHGSLILIEPGEQKLSKPLKSFKKAMSARQMNVYSPCSCENSLCEQFGMARVDISSISIIQDLKRSGAIASSKVKQYHNFEYVILRTDGLKKYESFENKIKFADLGNNISKTIKFKAYILYVIEKEDKYSIKICDGSCTYQKDIWLTIPKRYFEENINMGRGGIINVKNARVVSDSQIEITISSLVEMER